MVQVRHVPDGVHRELKARAARAGVSLSDYVLAELVRVASRPSLDELHQRVLARDLNQPREGLTVEIVDALAAEHDDRERALAPDA